MNSKLTRKEALKLLGGGLAATALGVGFSAEEADALSQIKTGVFPYQLANPNLPTLDRCTRLMDTGRPISFTSSRQANDRLFNHSVHLSSRWLS